jgi:hypothetical protein
MVETKKKAAAKSAAPAAAPAKKSKPQSKTRIVAKKVVADKKNGDSRKTRVSRLVSRIYYNNLNIFARSFEDCSLLTTVLVNWIADFSLVTTRLRTGQRRSVQEKSHSRSTSTL